METTRFLSELIDKVSKKHDMQRSTVANYIRTKISFHLVRTQVLCIRGSRTLMHKPTIEVDDVEVVQGKAEIRR